MNVEDLRLVVYRSFATAGRVPDARNLAVELHATTEDVSDGLGQLARARHLVLDASGERVVMAHPFSSVPVGFAVMGAGVLWWGGCAWDSFALPQLVPLQAPMLVSTRCPACLRPHVWDVGRDAPPPGEQVAHFLVPAEHMWMDVVHTCRNQRIFCSPACVEAWLASAGAAEGYVMDLTTLWRLAEHWYDGRLERAYQRRDPAVAQKYLRSVGLSGSFWGLA
jgi:hypothetical protein